MPFLKLGIENTFRFWQNVEDLSIKANLKAASPIFLKKGRIVFATQVMLRPKNRLKYFSNLGSNNKLRFLPANFLSGNNDFTMNIEARSLSVPILGTYTGAVMFYDIGDAFNKFKDIYIYQGVGLGLRILIPSLNRSVIRFDYAIPIFANGKTREFVPSISFKQAF